MNAMIAASSVVAGALAATLVHTAVSHHKQASAQDALYQQVLLEINEPRIAQSGPAQDASFGEVPLDALPEPGVPMEPGNARPGIAVPSEPPPVQAIKGAELRVVRTGRVVPTSKDPIWAVQLVVDGQVLEQMDALIGKRNKQAANRHIAGNESPLPVGQYRIDRSGISGPPFDNPELGRGFWVPVTPLFITGRSALGFHQDPSWGKDRESGTSGCIGLESKEATARLVTWIRHYNIHRLNVLA